MYKVAVRVPNGTKYVDPNELKIGGVALGTKLENLTREINNVRQDSKEQLMQIGSYKTRANEVDKKYKIIESIMESVDKKLNSIKTEISNIKYNEIQIAFIDFKLDLLLNNLPANVRAEFDKNNTKGLRLHEMTNLMNQKPFPQIPTELVLYMGGAE